MKGISYCVIDLRIQFNTKWKKWTWGWELSTQGTSHPFEKIFSQQKWTKNKCTLPWMSTKMWFLPMNVLPTPSESCGLLVSEFNETYRWVNRSLLLISSFNKLVPGANFRSRWKPTDRFRQVPTLEIRMRVHNPESPSDFVGFFDLGIHKIMCSRRLKRFE